MTVSKIFGMENSPSLGYHVAQVDVRETSAEVNGMMIEEKVDCEKAENCL